jgi:phosphate transport system ATP-binding protein
VDLRKPPPVRRLDASTKLTPLPRRDAGDAANAQPLPRLRTKPAALPNENGHARRGHDSSAAQPQPVSSLVSAPRDQRPQVPTVERMLIDDVSISYGGKRAVKNVSLPVRQGEVLALIGPSGCGKTTLLRSLNRLTELTRTATLEGRITLDGVETAAFEPTDLRRQVTMVFQQPNPFPMSVFDNVAYVLREQAKRRPGKSALRPLVEEALERAGLLAEVKDNLDHPALRLSGGQQQRLCIARALAANPEVLLLDEPCSALDPQSTRVIEDLIVKLREEVAVVIVTHNLQQAHRIADHVAFMYLGELVEYAPAEALFGSPQQDRTRDYISGAFG